MNENHYTIFVEPPFSPRVNTYCLIINSAKQFIAFDGKTSLFQVSDWAAKLSKHCHKVQVFKGKELGKLIISYEDQQMKSTNEHK